MATGGRLEVGGNGKEDLLADKRKGNFLREKKWVKGEMDCFVKKRGEFK